MITPEERAAIDAFPANRIQYIPTGKSYHDGYVWSEDENKLVLVNPAQQPNWNRNNYKPQRTGPREETLARREEIAEMLLAGAFSEDMADRFGLTVDAIRRELAKLRREGRDLPLMKSRKTHEREQEFEAFKARIVELHAQGLTDLEIMDAMGASESTIRNHRAKMGLKPNARAA